MRSGQQSEKQFARRTRGQIPQSVAVLTESDRALSKDNTPKHIVTDNSDLIQEVREMRKQGIPEQEIQRIIQKILQTRKRRIDKENAWIYYERRTTIDTQLKPEYIKINPIQLWPETP